MLEKTMEYIAIALFVAALATGIGSHYWLSQDNPVEELSEKIIQEQTGFNINLSPDTPEDIIYTKRDSL